MLPRNILCQSYARSQAQGKQKRSGPDASIGSNASQPLVTQKCNIDCSQCQMTILQLLGGCMEHPLVPANGRPTDERCHQLRTCQLALWDRGPTGDSHFALLDVCRF